MLAVIIASMVCVASDVVVKVATNSLASSAAGVTISNTEPRAKQIELAKTDSREIVDKTKGFDLLNYSYLCAFHGIVPIDECIKDFKVELVLSI